MDRELLDTSFTLYYVAESSPAYRGLYSADVDTLATWSRSLTDYLETHTPRYKDDLNDETEKTGVLRECKFTAIDRSSGSGSSDNDSSGQRRQRSAIVVEAQYAKVTYKLILYGGSGSSSNTSASRVRAQNQPIRLSLILAKASAMHLKRTLSFLEEKYAISSAQLKLPSTLLLSCLQNYVTRLSAIWASAAEAEGETSSFLSDPGVAANNDIAAAQRLAILKSVIGVLRIAISISTASEVAPELKTIDLEVPPETVSVLFAKAGSSSSSSSTTTMSRTTFLDELRKYMHQRTGLILPLTAEHAELQDVGSSNERQSNHDPNGQENGQQQSSTPSDPPTEPPLWVSKILCAAFAVSVDGRLKFASRSIEAAGADHEDVVRSANVDLLDAILLEARRRATAE